jgi:hypothetical protein
MQEHLLSVSVKNPNSSKGAPRNVVANQVRRARLALDVTQDELSGRLAKRQVFLDRVAITKVENGQRCVFDFELKGLAEVLKVDVRWLLGMQEYPGPSSKGRLVDEV